MLEDRQNAPPPPVLTLLHLLLAKTNCGPGATFKQRILLENIPIHALAWDRGGI